MQLCPIALVVVLAACGRVDFAERDHADGAIPDTGGDATIDPLTVGCVLRMRMDEPAWTGAANEVVDDCGGNPGTMVGTATTVAHGTRGRAGLFGGNDCIEIADAPNLRATTGLTISAWIFPTGDPSASFGIVSKRVDFQVQTAYSLFLWTNNQVFADIDTENDRFNGNASFPASEWHQTTVVYDATLPMASRSALYIDGVLDRTAPETSSSITQFTSPLWVGCLPLGGPAQGFVGMLDDIGVWSRALSATEVAAWYARTN